VTAGRHDLRIEQGETFIRVVQWKDSTGALVDLTGYSGFMQIRSGKTGEVVLDVDGLPSGVVLGGAAGTATVTIPPASTLALPEASVLNYDLKVISGGGQVTYLIEGTVYVRKQVSA
jgi:hypothetical protein